MSKRLNVYKDQKLIYDIVMEPSFDKLQEEVSKFHLEEHKICIVTDTNVAPLYLEEVKELLSKCCKKFLISSSCRGEHKNLDAIKKSTNILFWNTLTGRYAGCFRRRCHW